MSGLEVGDRVQVFNPGPLSIGTVEELAGPHTYVRWEDGSSGRSQTRLLRKLLEDGSPARKAMNDRRK
jgi:hypothetical protein